MHMPAGGDPDDPRRHIRFAVTVRQLVALSLRPGDTAGGVHDAWFAAQTQFGGARFAADLFVVTMRVLQQALSYAEADMLADRIAEPIPTLTLYLENLRADGK
jgi:hypothetical protein